jgi:DNA-binding transcriptional ArsR family regulator
MEDLQQPPRAAANADWAPAELTTVADVETLRALADPTRLEILTVLMEGSGDLPVMSVKELAARLGQPQTKLYRHVKHLETAGLIRVAATRMVSGILEQRYQASQRDLQFDPRFMRAHADEAEQTLTALFDGFRAGYIAAFRNERFWPENVSEAERFRVPEVAYSDSRVSPARAAEIKDKLREVMALLGDKSAEDPDGVPVYVLIGYFTGAEPEPS